MESAYKYDVAISFAEEDRCVSLALALALEMAGFKKIYYYHEHPAATAGKVLNNELRKIYAEGSKYIVLLLSKAYLKKSRNSAAKVELSTIYDRIEKQQEKLIVIPVRLQKDIDLSQYPKLKKYTYIDWDFNPKIIAGILKNDFGSNMPLNPAEFFAKKANHQINIEQHNNAVNADKQSNSGNFTFNL